MKIAQPALEMLPILICVALVGMLTTPDAIKVPLKSGDDGVTERENNRLPFETDSEAGTEISLLI